MAATTEAGSGETKLAYTHPKSKFLKAITDRQQEIAGWAREGRPHVEYARQMGQLTENVTLDMMLQEHLFELSRARYKFKVNNRYEKKMFLQRQMMKSSVLRDKLKDVQIEDRRPKWAQGRPVLPPRPKRENKLTPQPPPSRTPSRMLRKSPAALQTTVRKPDSAPLRRNPVLVTEAPRAQTRTTFYEPSSGAATKRHESPAADGKKFFATEPDLTPSKRRRTPTILESASSPHGMLITPTAAPHAHGRLSPRDATPRKNGILRRSSELYPPPKTAPERLKTELNITAPPTRETKLDKESLAAMKKAKLETWTEATPPSTTSATCATSAI